MSKVWWIFAWQAISLKNTTKATRWHRDVRSGACQPNKTINSRQAQLMRQGFPEEAHEPIKWQPAGLEQLCRNHLAAQSLQVHPRRKRPTLDRATE